jgi:DNA-directed RNA polymerase subunit RPC12/RpoP
MPQKQKINLTKVNASLNTRCPKCGYSILPPRLLRVDFENVVCPECGERFVPGAGNSL